MREKLILLLLLLVFFVGFSIYFKHRATTFIGPDGSCQSLTVEDECQ
jgi:ABC-type cobalt transport system substrate-binding protein